jgi:hypothetical protein
MDKQEQEALKKSIKVLQKAIQDGTLQGEDRIKAERTVDMAAGRLLSVWFPVGWGRKVIMLVLVLFGFYGLIIEKPLFLICWVIAVMFSPRIVGEVSFFLGKITRKK